jgi:hypothetical protein
MIFPNWQALIISRGIRRIAADIAEWTVKLCSIQHQPIDPIVEWVTCLTEMVK